MATTGREESEAEEADRQFDELLQELRIAQAGVQILFAFLLVLPFQSGFTRLAGEYRSLYALSLLSALLAACLLISPVALHRILFHQQMKPVVIGLSHRLAIGGLAFLAIAMSGAVSLALSVSAGQIPGAIAGVGALILFSALWFVWPTVLRTRSSS
ncbi:MAG: DUF6328 family protein [Actinomycetia bacterium]|nr:DUF6328 family protein [Actinomycetes bacterium]